MKTEIAVGVATVIGVTITNFFLAYRKNWNPKIAVNKSVDDLITVIIYLITLYISKRFFI